MDAGVFSLALSRFWIWWSLSNLIAEANKPNRVHLLPQTTGKKPSQNYATLSMHRTPFFDIICAYMSQSQTEQVNARARMRSKREVPKGANVNPSKSGWIAIALVAATFIAMRFFGQVNGEHIDDLSVTNFKRAIEEHRIAKVERIRDLDS